MDHSNNNNNNNNDDSPMREASSSPLAISPVSASSSRKRQQQSVHSTNNSNAASTPNKHLRVQDKVVAETMEEFLSNPEHYYPCRGWVWDTFGPDSDTAMLHCIRKSAHRAVRKLLVCGDRTVLLQMENAKGITPLILAAQNGQLETVKLFLQFGADACHVASSSGKTAVLQAAHFGRLQVLQYLLENTSASSLMELENSNATTPLMRASQEGHLPVVKYLVQKGASVNRKNRERMTALMLASQRGHEKIVHYLIDHGYAELDSMTSGNATAVTLATKRNHFRTVQALVSAGCELLLPNSRGQTPQQIALEKHKNTQLADLLEPSMQVHLMRSRARQQQSWALVRMWILIQRQRAYGRHSTHIFLRIMNLPAPLLQLIVEFTPLPDLWDKRIGLLTKRCAVNATAGLESALDLLDEVLEEGGFLHACDELGSMIPPPKPFATWLDWKGWCRRNSRIICLTTSFDTTNPRPRIARPNATLLQIQPPRVPQHPTLIELRRYHGRYLERVYYHYNVLQPILTCPPYNMHPGIFQQLANSHDITSLVRRFSSSTTGTNPVVSFDPSVAMDIILLTSRLCSWSCAYKEQQRL